jgi:hypothetical protein
MSLLRFTDTTGTQQEILLSEAEIEDAFGVQASARAFINRDRIEDDNIERGETEMFVVDDSSQSNSDALFGGLFREIDRQGAITQVFIDSFERYARFSTPTDGGERFENVDDVSIVSDAISSVQELSSGVVENVAANPVSLLFSHTSPAKKLRETADTTSAELRYNADKTIDYLNRRGTDRTSGPNISPSNQNITNEFQAERKGGKEDVTHLRVLGAGEGIHQTEINFAPADDPTSYNNKETYINNDFSSGDTKKWKVIANKDLKDEDALQEFGRNRINDINSAGYIDVTTTIRGLDVKLGDTFTVVNQTERINEDMRVVELTENILPNGNEYAVKLSSRRVSRIDSNAKDRQDIQRYNKSLEGTAVPINASGGRQPVNPQNDYEMQFYYPAEVEFEHRLNVRVSGLPYRAYSSGAASGGDHTHDVVVSHPTHSHNVSHPTHSHTISSAQFSHDHSISVTSAETTSHSHSQGTLGTDSHGHPDGTLGTDSHDHTDGTLGTDNHGHISGALGTDSHDHSSGVLGTDSHDHSSGFLDGDNHDHTDGTLGTDTHGHSAGTGMDTGNHAHLVDVSVSSEPQTPRDVVTSTFEESTGIGNTNGFYQDIGSGELLNLGNDYEFCLIHFNATVADGTIRVRAVGEVTGEVYPRTGGIQISGSNEPGSASGTIMVPKFDDDITVQYKTFADVDGGISALGMFAAPHSHNVPISVDSQSVVANVEGTTTNDGAGVSGSTADNGNSISGSTGDDNAGVSGSTQDNNAGVSGSTGSTSPGVSGSTANNNANVSGSTGNQGATVSGNTGQDNPGVSGSTEQQGGTRTGSAALGTTISSETALGTTDTESTEPNQGAHSHDPEPGIIESFPGTTTLPSNCDVVINGTSIGTSFGDGTSTFDEPVDIRGELIEGTINTIRITSDTLGHIQAFVEGDVYRQILGNG